MRTNKKMLALAAVAVMGMAASSQAAVELFMDINSASLQAVGGFTGLTHTGTLSFTADANTSLAGVQIDFVDQGAPALSAAVSGSVNLVGGVTTGGSISISFADGNVYAFNVLPGGMLEAGPGVSPSFSLTVDTAGGTLATTSLSGVNVAPWDAAEPLEGALTISNYRPNSNGWFDDVNLDAAVFVPEPASMSVLGVMAAGLMARARRR